MAVPTFVESIVMFLRAGYPDGVPEHDYIPLFALLARQLTNDEVSEVAGVLSDDLLRTGQPTSVGAIGRAIADLTREKPLEADIARVSAHLAAGGWPLAPAHSPHTGLDSGASTDGTDGTGGTS
ncbi:uncharacterized protein DUF3349 [Jatrophihabitans sp. GAS493]|uniref:DUF3349 domain-containing protein n=1 Tax=Jatrophihabitans sp. GAS493 TaxID=1907575 RepID=UPI000BB82376|nr:DUF3349 domain-containing protein [Jatrophihabitans sp. GAS493]SOD72197.1 uncharacterized protein DUF3349 [Jatrophihabitans sp. GAS493]